MGINCKLKEKIVPWEYLISETIQNPPEGYLTAREISKKTKHSYTKVKEVLRDARLSGKIKPLRCRGVFYYPVQGAKDVHISI